MPRHKHFRIPCPDCRDPQTGKPRGLLWLGGNDYMTCPNCEGKGWFEMIAEPKRIPGTIILPNAPQELVLSERVAANVQDWQADNRAGVT